MFKDDITRADLLFQIRLLKDKVGAFESGEKYIQMQEECEKIHLADLRTIRRLEKEKADARMETIRVRNLWYTTCIDVIKEKDRLKEEKDKEIEQLKKRLDAALKGKKEEHQKYVDKCGEVYEAKTQLEDEKEKNQSLNARINKDYSNSSESSSMNPNHKTIHNSREKTGKKPGGQTGHIHNGRKRRTPTKTVELPTPDKYRNDKNYKPTGRKIRKQLIRLHVITEVIEYVADEYRNQETGQRVHADFPSGIVEDVTYDGTVKAMAYLINNELYTSIDKTRKFLDEISHGEIALSTGFICKLSKEFSEKTEEERKGIFLKLLSSPVMHADFTFGRADGRQTSVIITAAGDTVMYQGRKKKGDEGIKGSPLELYEGMLVSDHEAAIIKHGSRHQECLSHLLRYAKSGIENEPEKTWHKKLAGWIKKSVSYWNNVDDGNIKYSGKTANLYIDELREILKCGKSEYEYEAPTQYFRDGINTYTRMTEKFEDYVLFLRDPNVPPTNNLAERAGRKYKRKSHQVMSFRSDEGSSRFCDGLTITESLKAKGENLYDAVAERFNKSLGVII